MEAGPPTALCYHPGLFGGHSLDAFTPDRIFQAITSYVVLLFSLSVHEAAHAWAALRLGDDTAAREGRVSLNPIVHIDPIGTVLMPLAQFLASGIPLLAWAKPTPVMAVNFRPGWFRSGQVLVAAAGPLSNVLLATLFLVGFVGLRFLTLDDGVHAVLMTLTGTGVLLNASLALFNLLPLPPLDGSHMASWGLPRSFGERYDRLMEPLGSWPLLILVASGVLGTLLSPILGLLRLLLQLLAS